MITELKLFDEALTIPENPNDATEKELRNKIGSWKDHADRIIRLYRNQVKNTDNDTAKEIFVKNFDNVKDLFKTYD